MKKNHLTTARHMLGLSLLLSLPLGGMARDYHVSASAGHDNATGTRQAPLKTISEAATRVKPGDVVIVHEGVYREHVAPTQSGTEKNPIVFMAAEGERVEVKGSEEIKNWKHLDRNTWLAKVPNSTFGTFNPYADTIHGDWLAKGSWCHTGEVYLNDVALAEVPSLDSLMIGGADSPHWFARAGKDTTYIWANFIGADPNKQLVEINARQSVFYPDMPFVNHIHVKGFHMSQAATPWAPPTAEQPGVIGTHWSKGWVIEDNVVSHSKCVGITLGKYGDEWDNRAESAEGYVGTVERALKNKWDKKHIGSHIVRRNEVMHCGQAGIAGSLGAIFSTISDNEIHDIGLTQQFWGYEVAGIKFHAAVDALISHNHVHHTEGGIWLDWMTQGTHITRNVLHDNRVQDFSLEVNHGPILVDNNLFLSHELAQIKLSQGVAFVNNTIAWQIWPTGVKDDRETPFLEPHGTAIMGLHDCPCGNAVYRNNLFLRADMTPYDACLLPVRLADNQYAGEARPAKDETNSAVDASYKGEFKVVKETDGWYLTADVNGDWKRSRPVVKTSELGMATIPGQAFTRKGVPADFTKDCLGNKRNKKSAWPGAIEFQSGGKQKIKIF